MAKVINDQNTIGVSSETHHPPSSSREPSYLNLTSMTCTCRVSDKMVLGFLVLSVDLFQSDELSRLLLVTVDMLQNLDNHIKVDFLGVLVLLLVHVNGDKEKA